MKQAAIALWRSAVLSTASLCLLVSDSWRASGHPFTKGHRPCKGPAAMQPGAVNRRSASIGEAIPLGVMAAGILLSRRCQFTGVTLATRPP
ncbi:MAG: hypothetical protein AAFX78_20470 [Cyanobacteria bacterium J06638_20]